MSVAQPCQDTARSSDLREAFLFWPVGRLIEISGLGSVARTTVAVRILRQAQIDADPTAWVQRSGGALYPPDLHACGVDLAALVVVHIPRDRGVYGLARAAELLLRSGAFGAVIVDLIDMPTQRPLDTACQGRLLSLAREHRSRVVLLSANPQQAQSLGPLVSLRVCPERLRALGGFEIDLQISKNKSGLPLGGLREFCLGPPGLL
ncbi:MAG: recombinase A [Myxococcota bacterium]